VTRKVAFLVLLALAAAGCRPGAPAAVKNDRLQVVATTTIVGDVVRQVGGEAVDVQVLVPAGADPHAFEPAPQDVARVAKARMVFANGAGLEGFLDRLLANAGGHGEVVRVSDGITLRELGEGQAAEAAGAHDHEEGDPHVWTDPNNVVVWTHTIEDALARLDPKNAARYHANATAYRAKLQELDAWVRGQVARVPEAKRKLVVDHEALGYFADRYGFQQVGTVFPGFSTLAEPSAQGLVALEEAIRRHGVKAVFAGSTVNPGLARRVAADTGTALVTLYTGSLTPPGGDAATYIDLVRHNVAAIVEALR